MADSAFTCELRCAKCRPGSGGIHASEYIICRAPCLGHVQPQMHMQIASCQMFAGSVWSNVDQRVLYIPLLFEFLEFAFQVNPLA